MRACTQGSLQRKREMQMEWGNHSMAIVGVATHWVTRAQIASRIPRTRAKAKDPPPQGKGLLWYQKGKGKRYDLNSMEWGKDWT